MKVNIKFKLLGYLVFATLLFGIAGCTPKISRVTTLQEVKPLQAFKSIDIDVKSETETMAAEENFQITSEKLIGLIKEKLVEANLHESEDSPKSFGKKLVIDITINKLNYVSTSARVAMGLGAGEAILGGVIILKDVDSQEEMGSIEFFEKSGTRGGVFSPNTGNQMDSVSDRVVKLIAENSL